MLIAGPSSAEVFSSAAEARLSGAGSFGSVVVGSGSGSSTVRVGNVGAQTLSISGVSVSGVNAADFSVLADGCAGASLAFGQSCSIVVGFSPSVVGAESAVLSLSDNEASPGSVGLSGSGLPLAFGPAGAAGGAGSVGAPGATGAAGPAGAKGAVGQRGRIVFVWCSLRARGGGLSCSSESVASPFTVPEGVPRSGLVRISRAGRVVATGRLLDGRIRVRGVGVLAHGRYVLRIRSHRSGRVVLQRLGVVL